MGWSWIMNPELEARLETALAREDAAKWMRSRLESLDALALSPAETQFVEDNLEAVEDMIDYWNAETYTIMDGRTLSPEQITQATERARMETPRYIADHIDHLELEARNAGLTNMTERFSQLGEWVRVNWRQTEVIDFQEHSPRHEPEVSEDAQARAERRAQAARNNDIIRDMPDARTINELHVEDVIVRTNASISMEQSIERLMQAEGYSAGSAEGRLLSDFLDYNATVKNQGLNMLSDMRMDLGENYMQDIARNATGRIQQSVFEQLDILKNTAASQGLGELVGQLEELQRASLRRGGVDDRQHYEQQRREGGPPGEEEVRNRRGRGNGGGDFPSPGGDGGGTPPRGGGGGGGLPPGAGRWARRFGAMLPLAGGIFAFADGIMAYNDFRGMQSAIDEMRERGVSEQQLDELRELANRFLGTAGAQLGAGFVPIPGLADGAELSLGFLRDHLAERFDELRDHIGAIQDRIEEARENLEGAMEELAPYLDRIEQGLDVYLEMMIDLENNMNNLYELEQHRERNSGPMLFSNLENVQSLDGTLGEMQSVLASIEHIAENGSEMSEDELRNGLEAIANQMPRNEGRGQA